MPPPPNRFPTGPTTISPYQHQFPPHGQGHAGGHPPPLGNPAYINPNAQLNPFAANGALSLAAGLNAATGFGAHDASGLGSHAARLGFSQGAALQQHHQQQQQQHHPQQGHGVMVDHPTRNQTKGRIREVWKHNLHEEMAVLRDLIERYSYISMDTTFPGVVCRPMGSFRSKRDYHYQCLRANVDMLNVIQIGITLFNEDGENPPARPNSTDVAELLGAAGRRSAQQGPLPYTWQFNFQFSLKDDMYSQSQIESLLQAGIDFVALERDGINPKEFASLMISSGMVCDENISWISFHSAYDFGYLLKLLWCNMLPEDQDEFKQLLRLFFPNIYDVKYFMKHQMKPLNAIGFQGIDGAIVDALQKFDHKSTLETLAEVLKVKRTGPAHQAGSDSLLTGRAFFQMREKVFGGKLPEDILGQVWGLEDPEPGPSLALASANAAAAANQGEGGANGTQGHHLQHHQQQQQQNGPSTPNTVSASLVTTPGAVSHSHNTNGMGAGGMGPMTPGGGGGAFGHFAFSSHQR
ncbi:hypothetical protein MCOR25_001604 [Pyricularia grisea]|nr:hypothetical protein MCOR25_001604 [Pyricularia grisea]